VSSPRAQPAAQEPMSLALVQRPPHFRSKNLLFQPARKSSNQRAPPSDEILVITKQLEIALKDRGGVRRCPGGGRPSGRPKHGIVEKNRAGKNAEALLPSNLFLTPHFFFFLTKCLTGRHLSNRNQRSSSRHNALWQRPFRWQIESKGFPSPDRRRALS